MKSVPQNLSICNTKCDARVALNARARRKKILAKFRGAKKNWRRRLGGQKKYFFQQNLNSDV